ncbi:MAG: hypothetical protein WBV59_08395 [Anaerolineae bacterium]
MALKANESLLNGKYLIARVLGRGAAVPNVAWFLTTEITKNAEKLPICV